MPSGFVPNKNFPSEIEREPQYTRGLAGETENAATAARAFAPVRTGAYRDSIGVVKDGSKVYLSASDFKAWWIEKGSINNPPLAPLARGVRAAGLKFVVDK